MNKKISIIGGGEIGEAIAFIAKGSGIPYSVWDNDSTKATAPSLEECLSEAEVIFFCVPSWALGTALISSKNLIDADNPIVLVSKGLYPENFLSAPEIAEKIIPGHKIVFIGGPMIAEEIIAGKGCRAVIAGEKAATEPLAKIFTGPGISAETADSALSVALAGVMKNIYAMALGAAEGMGIGLNVRSYVFSLAIAEMEKAVSALGGDGNVAFGAAGIGDLIATGMSGNSSNWKAGYALASGKTPEKKSEGMSSIEGICSRIGENTVSQMALIGFIRSMVKNNCVSRDDWNKIF